MSATDPLPPQIITPSLPPIGGGAGSVPITRGYGRATAQTAANASVATFTVGAADGSFVIGANVLITASTTFSFSVGLAWTDEGNTARSTALTFLNTAGTQIVTIDNTGGTMTYMGRSIAQIRAKAGTAITISTSGTFTTVTYNVEGLIQQVA